MTVSAATRLRPCPPALVLSRKRLGAFFPPFWNLLSSSRRSAMGVDPSIRHNDQPLNSVAQS